MAQRDGPYGRLMGGVYAFNDEGFQCVRSLSIGLDEDRIKSIEAVYERDGARQAILHGVVPQRSIEIGPLNASNGYIKAVRGTYVRGTLPDDPLGYISSLEFFTTTCNQ